MTHKFDPTAAKATRDERRAQATNTVDAGMKALVEEIQAGKSDRYVAWLRFAAQFHRYSTANQWLIMEQCRERDIHASHIASYRAWQELGFQVRRGEKALYIWAPRPYSKEVENEKTHEVEVKSGTGFVLVPVFDASQIAQGVDETGQPYKTLPHFFTPLPESAQAAHLYEVAVQVAEAEGFTCQQEARSDGIQGWSHKKIITVKSGRDSLSTFNTFLHEYAHGLLHWDGIERTRQQKEGEAESVAYIVAAHFGLHNPFSSDYLISWENDEKSLLAYMDRIRATAHAIIEKMEAALCERTEGLQAA